MTSPPIESPSPMILVLITAVIALPFCFYILWKIWKYKKATKPKMKYVYGTVLAISIFSLTFSYFLWQIPSANGMRAVIIDQLVLTGTHHFTSTAMNILSDAGYTVDYYRGEDVTVKFYRNIPTYGYRVIIIRAHSRPNKLFTGEQYDQSKYIYEQVTDQLVHVLTSDTEHYFAITQYFVEQSMRGKFQNSAIIMMGCNSLTETDLAEAFIERGAKVCIGWTTSLLLDTTDQATLQLLEYLITEGKTVEEAVTETIEEVGSYPALAYYPSEAGTMVIGDE